MLTSRRVCEEMEQKKKSIEQRLRALRSSTTENRSTPRQSSPDLRRRFAQPVVIRVTELDDESLLSTALRRGAVEEKRKEDNTKWKEEKNRVILNRGLEMEKGVVSDTVGENAEAVLSDMLSTLNELKMGE